MARLYHDIQRIDAGWSGRSRARGNEPTRRRRGSSQGPYTRSRRVHGASPHCRQPVRQLIGLPCASLTPLKVLALGLQFEEAASGRWERQAPPVSALRS
jgi:hypothetical protein